MIVQVLTENTALSEAFGCEHGLSLYIETPKHRLLYDTGASGLFARNAVAMGADLSAADIAVLSHGHYDHGGGLETFLHVNAKAEVYAHKQAFGDYWGYTMNRDIEYIGLDRKLLQSGRFVLCGSRCAIDEELSLFADVTGKKYYPAGNADLLIKDAENYRPDDFVHEQNLIIKAEGKAVLITGCAHNGIVNIVERFKELEGRFPDCVIGGFHLSNPETGINEDPAVVAEIAGFFLQTEAAYYTGHCTGLKSYKVLKDILGDKISYIPAGAQIKL